MSQMHLLIFNITFLFKTVNSKIVNEISKIFWSKISLYSVVISLNHRFGISKSQICMVGDRLDTDILFGQNGGCKTLLVLSGVTTLAMLQSPNNSIQPDFYTNKISDFLSLKAAAVWL